MNEQLLSAIDDLLDAAENFGLSEHPAFERVKAALNSDGHESCAKACEAEKAEVMANGLTVAETDASASCAGLTAPAAPVAVPLTDAEIAILAGTPCGAVAGSYVHTLARALELECAARWGVKLEGGEA